MFEYGIMLKVNKLILFIIWWIL